MARVTGVAYGVVAYLAFLASFGLFAAAAAGLFGAQVLIDGPPVPPAPQAAAIDLLLLLSFGVQHSVMARARFKEALAHALPRHLERSTFVLASAICLGALTLFWQPIEGALWTATPAAAKLLRAVSLSGFALTTLASYSFDHFGLFGLRQALQPAAGSKPAFAIPLLYRYVRHPMMLGVLLGVWATPRMTFGHLVFAVGLTLYILVGLAFEERDLVRELGKRYAQYRSEVPMLFPWRRRRPEPSTSGAVGREARQGQVSQAMGTSDE